MAVPHREITHGLAGPTHPNDGTAPADPHPASRPPLALCPVYVFVLMISLTPRFGGRGDRTRLLFQPNKPVHGRQVSTHVRLNNGQDFPRASYGLQVGRPILFLKL